MTHRHLQPVSLCLALGALWLAVAVAPEGAHAQSKGVATPVVYPSKGQSPQQQDRDRYECHDWARAQSGYDPARTAGPPPSTAVTMAPTASQDGATGAMARGAAGGAAIAELSSKDVGHGAAAGFLGAGAIHKIKERQAAQARQEQQQTTQLAMQQQAAMEQQRAMYGRAFGACLEGRGYVVK